VNNVTAALSPTGREQANRYKASRLLASSPTAWQDRLRALFRPYIWHPLSPPHIALWEWVNAINEDSSPRPFIAIWPRGRGKSTHAEMVVSMLGGREARRYCLYVCETQDQADKHVMTIRNILESDSLTAAYPRLGRPRVGKNGSRTWRRNMLTADNDFTVEAIGLDKAVRGQKIDWSRPDLIVFDDVDSKHDKVAAVKKKEDTITTSILPAGSENCAVLFAQNLIHDDSIAHRLSKRPGTKGAADYLANRIVSGPFKAVDGLKYEAAVQEEDDSIRWQITAGRSLWAGFTEAVCEAEINREGPTAFELESQHEIDTDDPEALLSTDILRLCRVSDHPDFIRAAVAVDPSGGAGQCGIIAGGTARHGRAIHGYTTHDLSTPLKTESLKWAEEALRAYHLADADCVIVERNFGGDMAASNIRQAVLRDAEGKVIVDGRHVKIIEVNASRGKEIRAEPVASLFQRGLWHHVGYFPELEKQWTKWKPGTKPSPDRLDAEVWLATYLLLGAVTDPAAFEELGTIEDYTNPWT
jgi:hypothetical protein